MLLDLLDDMIDTGFVCSDAHCSRSYDRAGTRYAGVISMRDREGVGAAGDERTLVGLRGLSHARTLSSKHCARQPVQHRGTHAYERSSIFTSCTFVP